MFNNDAKNRGDIDRDIIRVFYCMYYKRENKNARGNINWKERNLQRFELTTDAHIGLRIKENSKILFFTF